MRQGREKKNDILVINVGERKYQKKKKLQPGSPCNKAREPIELKGYKVKDTVYTNM